MIFEAPRDLVWKIYTDPKLLIKWWDINKLKTSVEKMEIKTGGSWRVVQRDTEGNKYVFHGVFHLVNPYHWIRTMEWEGEPGAVMFETLNMEEVDGKTKVINSTVFQSIEDRDRMIEAGMETGTNEGYKLSVELLKELKK